VAVESPQNQRNLKTVLTADVVRPWHAVVAVAVVLGAVAAVSIARAPRARVDLRKAERKVFSQGGEDGVLEKIFEIIKPTSHYSIEFGGGDGVSNSNTRNLIVNHGWGGLFIEGDEKLAAKSQAVYKDLPRVRSIQAWIYPGNVEILFEENGVPKDLDLLVIDIDSNDYYVWRAIHDLRPKVVEIEFNGVFPPPTKAVVDFHPMNYWDGSDYFGASIQSLYELGKKKGYELVYADSLCRNLFFVDAPYFERFGLEDNSPMRLYQPPTAADYFGFYAGKPVFGAGRGPGKAGHPAWDLFEVEEDGKRVKPFDKDLTWEKINIKKRFVPR
jgi:hypothetical protein